jgi:hypothetical protein
MSMQPFSIRSWGAMGSRGIGVMAGVGCFIALGVPSVAKERPRWVDPPPNIRISAPSPEILTPAIPFDDHVDVTGSFQAAKPLATTAIPRIPKAQESTCTTLTYELVSGATVRVHRC